MRVVLLKDVQKLGRAGDIKEVSSGYARNYLIPRGLAQIASERVLKVLELRKAMQARKAQASLEKTQRVAQALDDFELQIPVRIGEEGKMFGSIAERAIAYALSAAGHPVREDQIQLDSPIKEVGEYPVTIQFDHGLESTIRVNVVSREEEHVEITTKKRKGGVKT